MEEQNLEGQEHINGQPQPQPGGEEKLIELRAVSGLYQNWFLDYASYVILERAVPAIEDGLKPVQRRILHAMREMEDGRFHKVANVIGQTMAYHPHGDAAIGEAIVNLGQKDLLIDTQGNWGDINTGDPAAAARYIEARLTKFALEVLFNPQTTNWQLSYDGRKREPVTLPAKFPLLLAQGVDGIAVGLATKIMPHNFCELIEASIKVLQGRSFELFPDFPTGGIADFTNYNGGRKGSRVKVRAIIEEVDKKTLVIRSIPYGTTTTSVMESIVKANDAGKIKIKKVTDNTAANVEIEIQLPPGTSPDITIDALFAFTDCEVSISPNACVIVEDRPHFLSVEEILRINTQNTLRLLERELQIKLGELQEKWHFSSLEKIFIEKRIYRDIEEAETWEGVIEAIDSGLEPYKKLLKREVTRDDITRLTEIKIKRISKFDSFKADELIKGLEDEIAVTEHHLAHLVDYAVEYFRNLLRKYGKGRERKTEIRVFENIVAAEVAIANHKLYANFKEGFIGYGLKKDEYVGDCSNIDDIIVFLRNGTMQVTKVSEKQYVGKDIVYANVWKKSDDRMVYHVIYQDGAKNVVRAKRFTVTSITRDKQYFVVSEHPNSKILYISANPNAESEVVAIILSATAKARIKNFDFDFGDLEIRGRGSQGNILTRYALRNIKFKSKGGSTVGGRDIWYDSVVGRLNVDKRGRHLGNFDGDDAILVLYKDGSYELTDFELTNRYEPDQVVHIGKWNTNHPITALYYDGESKQHYLKRFLIETRSLNKKFTFITEAKSSKLVIASAGADADLKLATVQGKRKNSELLNPDDYDVRGWKALGHKMAFEQVTAAEWLAREPVAAQAEEGEEELEGDEAPKNQLSLF